MKNSRLLLFIFMLPLLGFLALRLIPRSPSEPLPDESSLIAGAFTLQGQTYSVVRGKAWRRGSDGRWSFIEQLYDPDFFEKNYVVENGVTFRRDPESGKLYQMRKTFSSTFEEAASVRELIGEKHGWTEFTLQSPQARSIPEYVALRTAILKGEASFRDNRVEPSAELAHEGKQSLKCVSVAPVRDMITAKASLGTELIHFVKDDDLWFSGWYFLKSGMPYTLMDLECAWINQAPGLRIMIENGELLVELKWADKPRYTQGKQKTKFPAGKWVQVKAHFKLSEKEDGLVELWQDGVQIVSVKGRTLPLSDTVYNTLEIGISATSGDAMLYVDDIEVSDKPLP